MNDNVLLMTLIKSACGIVFGIAGGWSLVYVYNHIPVSWFLDYGETPEPDPGKREESRRRLNPVPWRYLFAMFFTICGIRLIVNDPLSAAAQLPALWILTLISVSDIKYRIVPDELVLILLVTCAGSVHYHGVRDILAGALAGFGIMAAVALLGKLLSRRTAAGGGDIKLMAALGALTGFTGILVIFFISTVAATVYYAAGLIRKRLRPEDAVPLVPFITGAAAVYMIFFFARTGILFAL